MNKLNELFSLLGLDKDNGLFITKEELWKTDIAFPNRVKRLIERKIEPDAFFCFDNKPMILFFTNGANKKELHKNIWNFNECPIVIFVENNFVEIHNGFKLENTGLLARLGGVEKLNDFTYFELVTGSTWESYNEELIYKNRVDYHLLKNIKAARKILVEKHELNAKITNAILGKVIFVRYLIDRGVKMRFDGTLRKWTNQQFCDLLEDPKRIREFFDYIENKETGFNGDLFPLNDNEYKKIKRNDFLVLKRLLEGDDIDIDQPSLFEQYDFSIIPIEFISNVYELFIGQDNQKKEGAYYTPLFLVDYILKETVERKLNKIDYGYNCKVLDPACGSGIFLVEALRKIIEKYISETGIETKGAKFKTAIKNLATENIFGIDKDLSAVQVAIFSIYLTLLDYLEPAAIEDAFKFPNLLNTNFFEADFFSESLSFNKVLENVEFDFILGNPPWKGNGMNAIGGLYLKNRKKREQKLNRKFEIAINNNEIVEAFVLRVSDFCKNDTQVSFIVRSSILYNLGYKEQFSAFRQYWLEEFIVDKVFELAPVRHEVFEKSNKPAIAPAAVLFYRYANGKETNNNIIEHISLKQSRFFSLFKIFTINRSDYKNIQQGKLKQFDWLWKVLVYGSYLDFNFIKRLKDDLPSIKSIISDKTRFVVGTGIQYSSSADSNSEHLIGLPLIDAYAVKPFSIDPKKISLFSKSKVHRLRDERLFKAPMLLIRKGMDMENLALKCAVSRTDALYKDSLTSINILNKKDINVLNSIAAVFSSKLLSYYAIKTFGSIGIEREQTQNYNKFSLPYLELNVTDSINKIEKANLEINTESEQPLSSLAIGQLRDSINSELENIDKNVIEKLNIDKVETALIDYALEINRILIIGTDLEKKKIFKPIGYKDFQLESYANIFLKRFKSKLDNSLGKFTIEIWHTNQIIGMFFKIVPPGEYSMPIKWVSKQNNSSFLTFLFKLGVAKITDKLFIQKDVRGFDNSGNNFYIIKPNEKRLWHEAIGYLDVNEFVDAILKTVNKYDVS